MRPSQRGKPWARSSGSDPKLNSLGGLNGPLQGRSAWGIACYRVLRHQWYSSDYLLHCLPAWNPAFPVMRKYNESSKRFSHFHHALFLFCCSEPKQKSCSLLLSLLCFGVEFISSPWPPWMVLACPGEENWEKKWWLSKCSMTDGISPLSSPFWSSSNQRGVRGSGPLSPRGLHYTLCPSALHLPFCTPLSATTL